MNATGLTVDDIARVTADHPGVRGLRQLRRTLQLVDGGAESPYESVTRLLLVEAGLPVPQTQIEVRGDSGRVFARLDMGWPQWQVAVEYDGTQHWTDTRQRAWDIDRTVLLEAAGWIAIRVSAAMLSRRDVHRRPRGGGAERPRLAREVRAVASVRISPPSPGCRG